MCFSKHEELESNQAGIGTVNSELYRAPVLVCADVSLEMVSRSQPRVHLALRTETHITVKVFSRSGHPYSVSQIMSRRDLERGGKVLPRFIIRGQPAYRQSHPQENLQRRNQGDDSILH